MRTGTDASRLLPGDEVRVLDSPGLSAAWAWVFRVTDGLAREFGRSRCFDTPLAEAGILGMAIGMAMNGLVPVVEMQFDAFRYPAFEQLVSHAAKMRNRTRGRVPLPLVVRMPYGGGVGAVEHHSDSSESYFAHTPGLLVVTPGTVADAYTLLRESISTPDPVVFLEPKRLYWRREHMTPRSPGSGVGHAEIRRAGTSATIITYGPSVPTALAAAESASEDARFCVLKRRIQQAVAKPACWVWTPNRAGRRGQRLRRRSRQLKAEAG